MPPLLLSHVSLCSSRCRLSVRVHPTSFSPTPNRDAGIKLKIKERIAGARGFGRWLLAPSNPRMRAQEAGFWGNPVPLPTSMAMAVALAVLVARGGEEGMGFPRGELTSPQAPLPPAPPFPACLVGDVCAFFFPCLTVPSQWVASLYSVWRCCCCAPFVVVSHLVHLFLSPFRLCCRLCGCLLGLISSSVWCSLTNSMRRKSWCGWGFFSLAVFLRSRRSGSGAGDGKKKKGAPKREIRQAKHHAALMDKRGRRAGTNSATGGRETSSPEISSHLRRGDSE